LIGYKPYSPPTASLDVAPTSIEVGQVVTAVFSGSYEKGARELISKVVTPTAGVDTSSSPFTFNVPGVTSPVKGIIASHTLTVNDGKTTVADSASILVKNRYYTGFSTTRIPANLDGFTSGLGSSIQEVFGGVRSYVVPNNHYIIWLTPDTWDGNLVMNNFPFAVGKVGTMNVTNQYGLVQTLNIWASVNYFGAGTLNIDMK
jgi:hypothetical protein